MFCAPEPAYFIIGNFPVYYYGIIICIAIIVGLYLSELVAVKRYCLVGKIPELSTGLIIGGFVGARLYYCLCHYNLYIHSPLKILATREGGLSIHGAIIGAVIVLYFYSKKNDISILKLCDILSIGLPLGQCIGRWGNFFNNEAFGLPTSLPWKLYIPQNFRPETYISSEYFHPTFLYESVLNLIIFLILYFLVLPKKQTSYGVITGVYLVLYSIVRFLIEGLRIDCSCYVLQMPIPQIISIITFIIGGILILRGNKATH